MNERTLDHVGVAVPSLDEALPLFESITGGKGYGRETVESQGVEIVFVGSGTGRMELLAPTRPDSPVGKFLAKRGSGMHHLCYRVPDVAAALEEFRRDGYELIDREPRTGGHGHRVAFLHPRSTGGVLIELLQAG
ncbi:MAG TPA: methylmalonyl-CoA epimerase [Longimicrobiaceae bacterium]|nr:methylmalonyl-CoA epimerase [Longimicrobiaceae bacterium]